MLFSIIIPVYNLENYLPRCINSILSQTYSNFQIILINDGSTDLSPNICESYNEQYGCVTLINQKNKGVSTARNMGLEHAKGEYILFLDGDDYWENDNVLAQLYKILQENSFPDMLLNNAYFRLMPNGEKIKTYYNPKTKILSDLTGEEALSLFLRHSRYQWSIWRNVYKSKVIRDNQLLFEKNVSLGEDADWLFRFILVSNRNTEINFPYYCYRTNRLGSAMNMQSYKNLNSYIGIVEKWFQYAKGTNNLELASTIRRELSENYMGYLKYIFSFNKEERESIIFKIKNLKMIYWVTSVKNTRIRNFIKFFGFEKVLLFLYSRYLLKKSIKRAVLKFN